jgi:hypothetical protein
MAVTGRKPDKLTGQEVDFCYAYIAERFNGTKAAKRARYKGTDNALGVMAFDLLKKPKIKAKIAELTKEYLKDTKRMAGDVIKELSILSFRRMSDYIEIDSITRRARMRTEEEIGIKDAAINKIEVKQRDLLVDGKVDESTAVLESEIKIWLEPKTKPLEILGKHLGVIVENKDLNVKFPNGEFANTKEVDVSGMSTKELKEFRKLLKKAEGKND